MIIQYFLALDLLGLPLNVLVVTGLNKALRSRLMSSKSTFQHLEIVPIGFADNMNELIDVADVCFIKPGPATMMECMHSRKPIIFGVAATPCEQAHANYAVSRGVAKYTGGNPMLLGMAAKHFLREDVREEVARRYEALALRNGAAEIAAFVDEVARGKC
jgi:UDP-N-acetylglucosamine:LPS N-acetylglucosamine transferase